MLTDCYERGHTPSDWAGPPYCAKCRRALIRTDAGIYHTQAELDRLWKGVDRQAASDVGGRHGG